MCREASSVTDPTPGVSTRIIACSTGEGHRTSMRATCSGEYPSRVCRSRPPERVTGMPWTVPSVSTSRDCGAEP